MFKEVLKRSLLNRPLNLLLCFFVSNLRPQALYLATLGGANALGLSSHLGSFEEGKCFDAVVLRHGFGTTPVGWTSESKEDLLLKIITLGDDRNVKEVFVDGRSVYQASDA